MIVCSFLDNLLILISERKSLIDFVQTKGGRRNSFPVIFNLLFRSDIALLALTTPQYQVNMNTLMLLITKLNVQCRRCVEKSITAANTQHFYHKGYYQYFLKKEEKTVLDNYIIQGNIRIQFKSTP